MRLTASDINRAEGMWQKAWRILPWRLEGFLEEVTLQLCLGKGIRIPRSKEGKDRRFTWHEQGQEVVEISGIWRSLCVARAHVV